jgi:hypothetical protein
MNMVEDLLTRQLNRARLLLSQGLYSEANSLVLSLLPCLSADDTFLNMQILLLLAETLGSQKPWQLESAFDWLDMAMEFGQRSKTRLQEKMRHHGVGV